MKKVKIVVNTFGTRGDVQPYVALGLGLQRAGHAVRIVQAVDDEAIKDETAQLDRQIRAEDGVGTAVALIETFAREGKLSAPVPGSR